MKYMLYLIVFLLALTSTRCDKSRPKPYYAMDPEFKKTFLQGGIGSYWIYTDSTESFYDTVTLMSAKGFVGNIDADYRGEGYESHYEATNCRSFLTRLQTSTSKQNSSTEIVYSYDFYANGIGFSVTLLDGKYYPEGSIEEIDSITILDKTYFNVTQLIRGNSSGYRLIIIDPEIGIVYKEAWAQRPAPASVRKFYLEDYKLK